MGVYLSSPIRDKVSEDDDVQTLRYGASSMQGWRTSQEDAHNCCTGFDPDTNTTLFACYDGHGGAEVAQYTAQHFPDYLKTSDLYKEGNLSKALEEGFLGFDAVLKEDAVVQKLKELAGVDDDEDESEQKEESNALFEEATMPLEELLSRYGRGGAKAAALLKKEQQTFQSPALAAKRENGDAASARPANDDVKMNLENELMNGHSDNENNENIERASNLAQRQSSSASSTQAASTTSPLAALRSLTSSSSSSQANEAQAKEETDSSSAPQRREAASVEGSSCVDSTTPDTTTTTTASKEAKAAATIKSDSGSDVVSTKSDSSSSLSQPPAAAVVETAASSSADSNNPEPSVQPSTEKSNGTDSQPSSTTTSSSTPEEPGSSSASSTSAGAAGSSAVSAGSSSSQSIAPESSSSSSSGGSGGSGGSSSSAGGSSEDTGPCSSSKQEPEAGSSTGRTRSKRKNVIPEEGEDESSFDEDSSDEDEDEEGAEPWADGSEDSSDEDEDVVPPGLDEEEEDEEDDEDQTTSSTEEPGSDSGCTSVVALLRGRELFVANAGDSRCVLCRGGKALDMSIDHKPEDELEHSRITKAGGRVTMDGRVNGGLNLSRAIGDHCYKRNTELSDREQMITALPDIRSTVLEEGDQFMVLACDGIWNVMTSQDVVNFVSERLKAGVTKLSSICEEMFEFCLSPDTSGDGTGCDNMTCIIVCFKQDKISNSGAAVKRQAESEVPESTDKTDLPDSKKARTDNEAS